MTPLPLPTREIKRAGLRLSEIGLGTATLGNLFEPVADEAARATLEAALEQGITYIDTAPYYGFGLSERRVGEALRERDGFTLSTKVGRLLLPDRSIHTDELRHGFRSAMPFEPRFDYSYDGVLRSFEDSLDRLGLSRVDIVYVHDIGAVTHGVDDARCFEALTRGGGLRALERLRSSGAIRGFGVGVNEIEACLRVMDHAHLDVLLLAGRYTLLEQRAHDELFPRCERAGTAVVIGGPYNSGILATGVKGQAALRYDYHRPSAEVIERVRQLEDLCDEFHVPLAAAALQFPLAQPVVVSVVPGLDRAERVAETLALYRIPIPPALWDGMRARGLLGETVPVPRAVSSR
jgi:D-threo-aldose 1-dehydrogenase